MAGGRRKENEWKEAKKRCRLNQEDIAMAKELGISPRSLIKNVPSPSQRWKAPVKEWLRELYMKKFGRRKVRSNSAGTTSGPPGDNRPSSDSPAERPRLASPGSD
jgi:hypothetical protein